MVKFAFSDEELLNIYKTTLAINNELVSLMKENGLGRIKVPFSYNIPDALSQCFSDYICKWLEGENVSFHISIWDDKSFYSKLLFVDDNEGRMDMDDDEEFYLIFPDFQNLEDIDDEAKNRLLNHLKKGIILYTTFIKYYNEVYREDIIKLIESHGKLRTELMKNVDEINSKIKDFSRQRTKNN